MKLFKSLSYIAILILPLAFTGCRTEEVVQTDSKNILNTNTAIESEFIKSDVSTLNTTNTNIIKSGSYTFSGKIEPIFIDTTKDDDIEIILDNVEIVSDSNPPIYVKEAKNIKIILAKNSVNIVTDNRTKEEDKEDFPNAAIYSMSDLKIVGESKSSLIVNGNLNDGITSKDDLKIKEANITVNAKDDGIRGKDSLEISEGILNITSGGDGLKSDNTTDTEKGIIALEESEITISAGDDGIDAVQKVEFFSGNTNIVKSYEGVEALNIIVHDGVLNITSEDDGINVAKTSEDEENSFFSFDDKKGGRHKVIDGIAQILGGKVLINAEGDGFDSNGNAMMSGGILIVHGPTRDGNGAIDVNGGFEVSGGTLMAIGSSGMAETPSENSSQNSLQVNFENAQESGTEITIKDENQKIIGQLISEKTFSSVTFSSKSLEQEKKYSLFLNGEKYTDITQSEKIIVIGSEFKRGPKGKKRNDWF